MRSQVRGILFLSLVLVLIGSVGCTAATAQWKQGEPVELPAEAAEFDDLQLLIDREGDNLAFEVRCKEAAEFTEVNVEVRTEGSVEAASYATTPQSAGETLTCEPGAVRLQGQTPVFNKLQTGDELWIRLAFHKADGFGAAKEHLYMMGTDGQLRDGGGSVWK